MKVSSNINNEVKNECMRIFYLSTVTVQCVFSMTLQQPLTDEVHELKAELSSFCQASLFAGTLSCHVCYLKPIFPCISIHHFIMELTSW